MVLIKLGYNPKLEYDWEVLPNTYEEELHKGYKVITIHEKLWEKVKNIIYLKKKFYDAIILITGKRRTGKSTLGKTIAYLLNPNITIKNYVVGLDESYTKLEQAEDGSVLIFDEGSTIANSKEMMSKVSIKLHKIIDVCGMKKLTLIFCMPSFFDISKPIAVHHSLFLLHTYTDKKLNRGFFLYFGTKKKKILYEIGKKNFGSMDKPKADWTGSFVNFELPFEKEYLKLKMDTLKQVLNPSSKNSVDTIPEHLKQQYKNELMVKFAQLCPEVKREFVWRGFGTSKSNFYRVFEGCASV